VVVVLNFGCFLRFWLFLVVVVGGGFWGWLFFCWLWCVVVVVCSLGCFSKVLASFWWLWSVVVFGGGCSCGGCGVWWLLFVVLLVFLRFWLFLVVVVGGGFWGWLFLGGCGVLFFFGFGLFGAGLSWRIWVVVVLVGGCCFLVLFWMWFAVWWLWLSWLDAFFAEVSQKKLLKVCSGLVSCRFAFFSFFCRPKNSTFDT
jgi:hypothetical protein